MSNTNNITLNIHVRDGSIFKVDEFDTFVSLSLGCDYHSLFLQEAKQARDLAKAAIEAVRILSSREAQFKIEALETDLREVDPDTRLIDQFIAHAKKWCYDDDIADFVGHWDEGDWTIVLKGTGLENPTHAQLQAIVTRASGNRIEV